MSSNSMANIAALLQAAEYLERKERAAEAEHGYAVSLPPTLMYDQTTNVITTPPPPQQVQQRSAPIAFHGKFSQNNNTVILASSAPASTSAFHGKFSQNNNT